MEGTRALVISRARHPWAARLSAALFLQCHAGVAVVFDDDEEKEEDSEVDEVQSGEEDEEDDDDLGMEAGKGRSLRCEGRSTCFLRVWFTSRSCSLP